MPRWLISDQTFTWFRQRYPGTEDTQTRDRLLHELILEWANAGAGAPIDKFRYPWAGRMVDLVVLIQNKYLTFADIRWQNVECNQDWLERDWPLPALEAEGAPASATDAASETLPSPPAAPLPQVESVSPTEAPDTEGTEEAQESVSPTEAPDTEGAEEAQELHGFEKDVIDRMEADPPRKDARGKQERAYATRLYNRYFKKRGVSLKRVQNIISAHRKTPAVGAPPKKTSRKK